MVLLMATIRSLIVKVGADISDLQRGLTDAQKEMARSANKLKGVGQSLSVGLTMPIMGVSIASGKMATDFNEAMANVATLIPGNIKRVDQLKRSVQELAIETGKSTDDISGGLYQVISAFGDTADTVKILETNVKAAKAGMATTTDAINLTSAVTKGYGDVSAEAVKKASDLAFVTVKLGQTTFPELAASIGKVVPLAAKLNMEQEEMYASYATLTGVTGNAAEVSTQMSAILRAMIKPTTSMAEAINKLGYNSASAMIDELGMVDALRKLIDTTDGSEEALTKLFSRTEALTAVFALTGSQAGVFDEKLSKMKDSLGAMEEAYAEQTSGINKLGHEWSRLKQKIAVTAQNLGDALAPAFMSVIDIIQPLIDGIRKIVSAFNMCPPGIQATILVLTALVAATGPVLIIAGQMVMAVSALSGVFAMIVSPIGATIAAITALVAGLIILWNTNDEFRKGVIKIWETIGQIFKGVFSDIEKFWDRWGDSILSVSSILWRNISLLFNTSLSLITETIVLFLNLISGNWQGAWENIKNITATITNLITDTFRNLQASWGKIWDGLKDKVLGIWDGMKEGIKNSVNSIIGTINGFIRAINNIKIEVPAVNIPLVGTVGGFTVGMPQIPEIPMLKTGTNYVPQDTLAYLHKGEAVVPAKYNNNKGKGDIYITGPVNFYGVQNMEQMKRELQRRTGRTA